MAARSSYPVFVAAIALVSCSNLTGADDLSAKDLDPTEAAPGTPAASSNGRTNAPPAPTQTSGVGVTAPEGLDLGEMVCGATSTPRTIEVHNYEKREIAFETWGGTSGTFIVTPPAGVVPPGGTTTLSVTASIGSTGPVGDGGEILSITTNLPGDKPHELEPHVKVVGAIFSITPSRLSYGLVHYATKTVTVRNDGNVDAMVSLVATNSQVFSVSPGGEIPLAPGASVTRTVIANPDRTGEVTIRETLQIRSVAIHCGSVPSVALAAERFNK